MSQRTAKPATIKNLSDWVARFSKTTNLAFDPETREPTIYSDAPGRAKVNVIPWKRESDTITVLSQPTRFPAQAVDVATRRLDKIRSQRDQIRQAGNAQLRVAEATLLDAWRTFHAAPAALRGTLRRDILSAEAELMDLEARMAPKDRQSITIGKMTGIYAPPMPLGRRGIGHDVSNESATGAGSS